MIKNAWMRLFAFATLITMMVVFIQHSNANRPIEEPMSDSSTADYQFPPIAHWQTAEGAKVYFVQSTALPMLDIEVVFDAGSARNGTQGGISALTNALLAEGAATLSADELHARFEAVGAEFESDAQRDMAYVKLRSLVKSNYLSQAVDTLALLLGEPAFPEAAFERERNQFLIALKNESQHPGSLASKSFYHHLFANHPYGEPVLGTPDSLKTLTPEAVRSFYEQYYVANNAVIALVGDITEAQAKTIAQQLSAKLAPGQAPTPIPTVAVPAKAMTETIEFPSEQTHIMMGMPGLKRGDEDYFPLLVGNHILGSNGMVSRLFQIIRNEHGLAYGAYSYFIPMREHGPYVMSLQTKQASAKQALTLLNDTVNEFIATGPTEEELALAKDNLLGGYALRFDSNEAIINHLAMIGFYDLPLDYNAQYPKAVSAVTLAEIKQAFKKRISTDHFVTVTVGQSDA